MKPKSNTTAHVPVFAQPLQIVRPTFPVVDSILLNFTQSLARGQVTNNGPWVVEFERQLEAYLGVPTLLFSSGQAALLAMVRAAGVDAGEVIVPAFTFAATAHAVVWGGGTPVFADIMDDQSFTIDPADVERRITADTVAIMAVDPYGIACDYAALAEIGRRRGLKVLIDSAPSFGAKVGGKLVGGFGDAQIFSFHATKAFNTMEGGSLCSHDAALMERAREIRNFGLNASGDCPSPGFNGKMMEICALIGLEQLKTFDAAAEIRRRCAKRISEGLAKIRGLEPPSSLTGQEPIWLYLPVVVDAAVFGADRNRVADLLARENLNVRKYYSPACHQMSVYATAREQPVLPISERIARDVLALPIYNDMTSAECDGIVEAFTRVARGMRQPS